MRAVAVMLTALDTELVDRLELTVTEFKVVTVDVRETISVTVALLTTATTLAAEEAGGPTVTQTVARTTTVDSTIVAESPLPSELDVDSDGKVLAVNVVCVAEAGKPLRLKDSMLDMLNGTRSEVGVFELVRPLKVPPSVDELISEAVTVSVDVAERLAVLPMLLIAVVLGVAVG